MRRLNQQHCPKSGFANPSGILQHSLEHWLKLTSPGVALITLRTSAVAASRSRASASSRVSCSTFVSSPVARELRRRTVFGALRRFNVLRRCVFAALPPALSGRLIASPEAQDGHRIGLRTRERIKLLLRAAQCPLWVKSGHVQCTSRCPLSANSGHRLIRLLHQRG